MFSKLSDKLNSLFVKRIDKSERLFGVPRSENWPDVRNQFVKDHNFCAYCKRKNKLEVHHIKPFYLFPELELDRTNLITLCSDCHFKQGHLMNWSSYAPDIIDECVRYRSRILGRPKRQ